MTTTNPAPVPAPGSDAAIAEGCTCPVLDNAHGAGIGGGLWWIDSECPMHGLDGYWQLDSELSNLTMRPRQDAPERQISTSDGVTWHTFGANTPPEQVVKPAPAQGQE